MQQLLYTYVLLVLAPATQLLLHQIPRNQTVPIKVGFVFLEPVESFNSTLCTFAPNYYSPKFNLVRRHTATDVSSETNHPQINLTCILPQLHPFRVHGRTSCCESISMFANHSGCPFNSHPFHPQTPLITFGIIQVNPTYWR